MLFWMTIIVTILGLLLFEILFEHDFEISCVISGVISGLAAIALLIEIIVLAVNYIGVNGYIQRMNTRHDMLVYQYENDIYDNDNDLGKRELIDETGQCLHAMKLELIHPTTKEKMEFTCDAPECFKNILEKLKMEV